METATLVELIKIRWAQFNGRRDYEFKVTLSFWTALALAVAGAATQQPKPVFPCWFLILLFVATVGLHWHWCFSIRAISNIDRDSAFYWEELVAAAAKSTLPDSVFKRIDEWKNEPRDKQTDWKWKRGLNWIHRHGKRNWSHVFQVGVTGLLALALVILLLPTDAKLSEKEKLEMEWLKTDTKRLEAKAAAAMVQPMPAAAKPTEKELLELAWLKADTERLEAEAAAKATQPTPPPPIAPVPSEPIPTPPR